MLKLKSMNGQCVLDGDAVPDALLELHTFWVPKDGRINKASLTKIDLEARQVSYKSLIHKKEQTLAIDEFTQRYALLVSSPAKYSKFVSI